MLSIVETGVDAPEAQRLMADLSMALAAITGADGRANFQAEPGSPGLVFLLALEAGTAVGCGALRPYADRAGLRIAEIKRMYAARGGRGIGSALLAALEQRARAAGFDAIWLETRAVNQRAVDFYLRHGYAIIANYGPYVGRAEAVCFEKRLQHAP